MVRLLMRLALWGVVAFVAALAFTPVAQAHVGHSAQAQPALAHQHHVIQNQDVVQKQAPAQVVVASAADTGETSNHCCSRLGCFQMCGACCAAFLASNVPTLDLGGGAVTRKPFENTALIGASPQALRKPPRSFV